MKQFLQGVSRRTEFVSVVLIAFGYLILISISAVISQGQANEISDSHLQGLVIYELAVMLILGSFLYLRGWNLEQLGFRITTKDTLTGLALVILIYLINVVVWKLLSFSMPGLMQKSQPFATGDLSLWSILVISLVNPVFEEVFVCGYVIRALSKRRGMAFAINISVGIRTLYHLYQGVAGIVMIIPLGLLFAYWFARTGRIWPLLVAHGLLDFIGLVHYIRA
jgi:membrane protease YdiL (CAAX protease family)